MRKSKFSESAIVTLPKEADDGLYDHGASQTCDRSIGCCAHADEGGGAVIATTEETC